MGRKTNAVGLYVKRGKYGGTFAHKDIAFEFASAISPVFKLYLIKEFQRLKEAENDLQKLEWDAKRFLSKNNYLIQTDAVKNYLNPDAAAVSMVWSYIGELVFNMLVLVGAVKMADRVVREMMGL